VERGSFLAFGPLDQEIRRKLDADGVPPGRLLAELMAEVAPVLPSAGPRLDRLFAALEALPFDHPAERYLNHPIRVAAALWRHGGARSEAMLTLALCHNIREVAPDAAATVEEAFLDAEARRSLGLLTIDRARERDPAYLRTYYDALAGAGLMALKGHDKLDNFLAYVLYDLDDHHFDVVFDQVCPRLRPVDPRLADYLEHVARQARLPEVKARWR
jgi:hypothetical protein